VSEGGNYVKVKFANTNRWITGNHVAWQNNKLQPDLGLIKVAHGVKDFRTVAHIRVAFGPPERGVMTEVAGFGVDGDGGNDLRHFYAKVKGYKTTDKSIVLATSVCSGDSGGSVIVHLDDKGHATAPGTGRPFVVAVIEGGAWRSDKDGRNFGSGGYVWPAHGANSTQIQQFLLTKCDWKRRCGPEGCGPQGFGGIIGGGRPAIPGQTPQGKDRPNQCRPPITNPPLVEIKPGPTVAPCEKVEEQIGKLTVTVDGIATQVITIQKRLDSEKKQTTTTTQGIRGSIDVVGSKLDEMRTRIDGKVTIVEEQAESNKSETKGALSKIVSAQGEIRWYAGLAALLGITGPAGLAIGGVSWLAVRRLKKRLKKRAGESPADPFPSIPSSDGPSDVSDSGDSGINELIINLREVNRRQDRENNDLEKRLLTEVRDWSTANEKLKLDIRFEIEQYKQCCETIRSLETELRGCGATIECLQDNVKQLVAASNGTGHDEELVAANIKIRSLEAELRRRGTGDGECERQLCELKRELQRRLDEIENLKIRLQEAHHAASTESRYVHVPTINTEAESYKTACRRIAAQYPDAEHVVRLIEGVASQLEHGQDVLRGNKPKPTIERPSGG